MAKPEAVLFNPPRLSSVPLSLSSPASREVEPKIPGAACKKVSHQLGDITLCVSSYVSQAFKFGSTQTLAPRGRLLWTPLAEVTATPVSEPASVRVDRAESVNDADRTDAMAAVRLWWQQGLSVGILR